MTIFYLLNSFLKNIDKLIISLPSSKSLNYFWNFGSLLGMIFFTQVLSGILLSFFYSASSTEAFLSIQFLMIEVNNGWVLRIIHFNGASFFFLIIFFHFFKALFFFSYRLTFVWLSGNIMLILFMLTAFLGYVLPWAQMSFWACTVITNLMSVIPIFGPTLVFWIWGSFFVSANTLKFFFVLHFLLPFISLIFIFSHLIFLHSSGSTSSIFCLGDFDKIYFSYYFIIKDLMNFFFFFIFIIFMFFNTFLLGDSEMFIEANSLVSPIHIVPEWYFLFAYAILRSIPNKLMGVLAMIFSIFIFFFLSFMNFKSILFKKNNLIFVYSFFFCSLVLSWIGACSVEFPFITIGSMFSFFYFFTIFENIFWLNFVEKMFL